MAMALAMRCNIRRRLALSAARFFSVVKESSANESSATAESTATPSLSIDRSGLHVPEDYQSPQIAETDMEKQLKSIITFRGGPITVAEYMEEVLTNPSAGYYLHQEVFGAAGSFITSPDVSQMFGEMIGIWSVSLWEQMGKPRKLQLVELGPGRGTLMQDLLRSTLTFKDFSKALSIHFVECSPALRKQQRRALQCPSEEKKHEGGDRPAVENSRSQRFETNVAWYLDLKDVPRGVPTIIIAQEFFDALPIHQFQKTPVGWCEKLIDVDSSGAFRFVLSSQPTAATLLYLKKRLNWITAVEEESIHHIEVCPKALQVSQEIAKRVAEDSGGGIIIDYGKDEPVTDSFQAIRNHEFVNVLDKPGTADLSAHVDFAAIKRMVAETASPTVSTYGPIFQQEFLAMLGINVRLEALVKDASDEQGEKLQLGYWRLVGEGPPPWLSEGDDGYKIQGMGKHYRVLAIADSKLGAPACFRQ
ncbi:protein arginine methyltransferase NDUFAF7, mitochondrial [Selaginella moellendorffii]|uniref:protein arginine methyltransferase NDUFAF7, mitochondrial n=1 Tax=Selaginella moellendorffii TaxID=88036 RepID=UPI000D1C364F|nr:protein arginine methyltransferase NDUFAF7, mitochondrial [Selaginella moellendorffii]|eukprot:XP_024540919.1 protein arginine methyltransferase NDUFAF7, mitochondrial [Selaginella moellendorffii]